MKNLLKKPEIEGLFAILALALASVSMWGCTDDSFEWGKRSDPRIVSLVDDSLVLLYNCRLYSVCHEGVGPLGYDECNGGCENYGLFLANYRKNNLYIGVILRILSLHL